MEETKEAILAAASKRVCDKLAQWNPGHPAILEIKLNLLASLPAIIEDRDEA